MKLNTYRASGNFSNFLSVVDQIMNKCNLVKSNYALNIDHVAFVSPTIFTFINHSLISLFFILLGFCFCLDCKKNLQKSPESNHIGKIRKEQLKMDILSITQKESDDKIKIECDGLEFYKHKDDIEAGMAETFDSTSRHHLSEESKERINECSIELEGKSLGQNAKQRIENKVIEQNRKRKYFERVRIK